MARRFCKISPIVLPSSYFNEHGEEVATEIDSVSVECMKCGNSVDIHGDSEASEIAGMVRLRETCPRDENNYYMKSKMRSM